MQPFLWTEEGYALVAKNWRRISFLEFLALHNCGVLLQSEIKNFSAHCFWSCENHQRHHSLPWATKFWKVKAHLNSALEVLYVCRQMTIDETEIDSGQSAADTDCTLSALRKSNHFSCPLSNGTNTSTQETLAPDSHQVKTWFPTVLDFAHSNTKWENYDASPRGSASRMQCASAWRTNKIFVLPLLRGGGILFGRVPHPGTQANAKLLSDGCEKKAKVLPSIRQEPPWLSLFPGWPHEAPISASPKEWDWFQQCEHWSPAKERTRTARFVPNNRTSPDFLVKI